MDRYHLIWEWKIALVSQLLKQKPIMENIGTHIMLLFSIITDTHLAHMSLKSRR